MLASEIPDGEFCEIDGMFYRRHHEVHLTLIHGNGGDDFLIPFMDRDEDLVYIIASDEVGYSFVEVKTLSLGDRFFKDNQLFTLLNNPLSDDNHVFAIKAGSLFRFNDDDLVRRYDEDC